MPAHLGHMKDIKLKKIKLDWDLLYSVRYFSFMTHNKTTFYFSTDLQSQDVGPYHPETVQKTQVENLLSLDRWSGMLTVTLDLVYRL